MQHIDEHTIELYVLGSELVTDRRTEIERHFAECHGCRVLAEEIRTFYHRADEAMKNYQHVERSAGTELVRSRQGIEPHYEPYAQPAPYRPATIVGRFTYFIRRHPVAAGVGSFVGLAALALMIMFETNKMWKDVNPAYVHLNPEQGTMEVYNHEHDMLWNLPSKVLDGLHGDELKREYERVVLFDLNEDGKNEVISSLPLGDHPLSASPLSVFTYDKKLLCQKVFQQQVKFRGAKYDDNFGVESIQCDKYAVDQSPEIIVGTSNGRSPTIIVRMDNQARILGSYVHYGYVKNALLQLTDGTKKLFVFGQNDLGEMDSLSFPVLALIDPEKIIGQSESNGTSGFGLPPSPAELSYLRFPLSDMNYLLETPGSIQSIRQSTYYGRPVIVVEIRGSYVDSLATGGHPVFEYVLSESLSVLDLKYSSGTLRLRQRLIAEGKLRGTFDQGYLENLKNGVRYWDGREWRKNVTGIQQPTLP